MDDEVKWVQHISGQGQKWKVDHECRRNWKVAAKEVEQTYTEGDACSFLPKSEYVPCDPPTVWTDVTQTCSFQDGELLDHSEEGGHGWTVSTCEDTVRKDLYRLRKVKLWHYDVIGHMYHEQWAFIVEHKEGTP
jgi:hypothetical protein